MDRVVGQLPHSSSVVPEIDRSFIEPDEVLAFLVELSYGKDEANLLKVVGLIRLTATHLNDRSLPTNVLSLIKVPKSLLTDLNMEVYRYKVRVSDRVVNLN